MLTILSSSVPGDRGATKLEQGCHLIGFMHVYYVYIYRYIYIDIDIDIDIYAYIIYVDWC